MLQSIVMGLMGVLLGYIAYQLRVIHTAVNSNTQKMLDHQQKTQEQVVDQLHTINRIETTLAEYRRQMGPLAQPEQTAPGPEAA